MITHLIFTSSQPSRSSVCTVDSLSLQSAAVSSCTSVEEMILSL